MPRMVASRRLLAAIIRRAVHDFVLYRDCTAQAPEEYAMAIDAAGWLFFDGEDTTDVEGRYTYLYICSLLDLDYKAIRAQALKLTRQDLKRLSGGSGDD